MMLSKEILLLLTESLHFKHNTNKIKMHKSKIHKQIIDINKNDSNGHGYIFGIGYVTHMNMCVFPSQSIN